jgi:hypothetical protein
MLFSQEEVPIVLKSRPIHHSGLPSLAWKRHQRFLAL